MRSATHKNISKVPTTCVDNMRCRSCHLACSHLCPAKLPFLVGATTTDSAYANPFSLGNLDVLQQVGSSLAFFLTQRGWRTQVPKHGQTAGVLGCIKEAKAPQQATMLDWICTIQAVPWKGMWGWWAG